MRSEVDAARSCFERALVFLRAGDVAMAEKLARSALEDFPGNANFLALLGAALNRLGRPVEAEPHLRSAIAVDQGNFKAHEALGQSLLAQHRLDDAAVSLREALRLNPRLESARLTLSQVLLAAGRNDAARDAFDDVLRGRPQGQRLAEAAEHHRAGRLEQAEVLYRAMLKQAPDDVTLLRLLGMLAIDTGHHRNATVLLGRAVELAPDFFAAWIELSRAQTEIHELDAAVASARRAVQLDPRRVGGHIALANALARSSQTQAAIDAYQQALEVRPDHAGVYLGLGNVLKTVGRQQEAVTAYREGIRLQPAYAELYWSLSNLKTYRFDDQEVAAMEHWLAQEGIQDAAVVHFCFALGKAYEDQRDFTRAFTYFERGNTLRRKQESYDPVQTEQVGERIRRVFTREFIEANDGRGCAGPAPIFVVGLPRSGSTLIEQILASHSQVEATHELAEGGRLVRYIDRQRYAGKLYPESLPGIEQALWVDFGQRYSHETQRYRSGLPRFIDKMPNNFALVGLLQIALPDARFINARRDPRDTCLSCYKQLFAAGQSFTYDLIELGEYYVEYQRMIDHWHQVLPGRVLNVQYEAVVADLEGQTRRMLEFCGLPWEPACLQFHATKRPVRTASSEQVRQPIYGDAIGVWRSYERELAPLLDILAPVLGA